MRSYVKSDNSGGDGYKPFKELSQEEKDKFFAGWGKSIDESLAYWEKEYWQAHENATKQETTDRGAHNTNLTEMGLDISETSGAKSRYKNNVSAIRLVKRLNASGKAASAEERKILALYSGWGGLGKAFDDKDESWQKEYSELKELLSPEEYESARATLFLSNSIRSARYPRR